MTAYGRGECKLGDRVFIAEARSVNHRYLDMVLRMPKNFLVLEKDLKALISSRVRRGRIEVFMEVQNHGEAAPYDLELNTALAKSYIEICHKLAELAGVDRKIPLETLLQMKDVITLKPAEIDMGLIQQGFQESLTQALDCLDDMRRREGDAIHTDFLDRTALLGRYLEEIEHSAPGLVEAYRKRLEDHIGRMLKDMALDENRLAQEIVFFAEKCDITEEIVRIKSHIIQFCDYLSSDDIVGRKLDFLIQEFNREVNTIGSKTADSAVSNVVVEMKAELEKMREQVQNVE